jgi:hypothetical protein
MTRWTERPDSESRMRADTHDGPEQIAPLQKPDTLMQLLRSLMLESPSCTARPDHTYWHRSLFGIFMLLVFAAPLRNGRPWGSGNVNRRTLAPERGPSLT